MKRAETILIFSIFLPFLSLSVSCSDDRDVLLERIQEEKVDVDETEDSSNENSENQEGNDGQESGNEQEEPSGNGEGDSTVDESITVATWKNFTKGAISHTWDDAYIQQVEIAIPLYDSYGMHTTLFVLPNKINDWEPYRIAYGKGHEIASHTLTHPSLDNLDISQTEYELVNSKDLIVQNMDFTDCYTLAYPYCHKDNFDLTQEYYIAARSCQGQIEKSTPENFMEISSILCGEGSSYYTTEHLNNIAESARDQNGWGVYMFHLIDGSGGYTIESEVLEQHLQYLYNNREDYWVESFVNVVKYIKERNSAVINVVEENSDQITISYSDNLEDGIYDFPITFKKEVPWNWVDDEIKVYQDSKECEFYILENDDKKYIIFNAVPDSGEIVINS